MPKGLAASKKALEIDNTLGEVHTPLAFIRRYYDFDWAGAEKEYKRAIHLSPNYAVAHQRLGQTYLQKKLFEDGIQELQAPIESAFLL
jgi:tetratricopeptide (TPR) repeat protein